MSKLTSLATSMLKVGLIGFGGGNALIPVIEEEAVNEKKMVSKSEYDKDIIAATLTPGALPVELASGIGYQHAGLRGMMIGGVCMALPGAILTILLLSVLGRLSDTVLTQVQYASIGITSFIMCLLTDYIIKTIKNYSQSPKKTILWLVIIGVFLLSSGKSLYAILQIEGTPIFAVNTISILLCSFFAILYTRCELNVFNVIVSILIGGIFLLCNGRANLVGSFIDHLGITYITPSIIKLITGSLMLILSIYGVIKSGTSNKNNKNVTEWKPMGVKITTWFAFILLLSIPALFILNYKTLIFDGHGLLSSLMSFGGGDAYLTIADGLFVPDYISENEFYNHLVLIVNILPGSILCKTLSGIGFTYGITVGKSVVSGILMAIAGFACSVAASCGVFFVVFHLYEMLEKIKIFVSLKKSIRVIVSGLLLTVMTGLIKTGMSINSNPNLPWFTVLIMILIIYILNTTLFYKWKVKNIFLIMISLVLSITACNILNV